MRIYGNEKMKVSCLLSDAGKLGGLVEFFVLICGILSYIFAFLNNKFTVICKVQRFCAGHYYYYRAIFVAQNFPIKCHITNQTISCIFTMVLFKSFLHIKYFFITCR